MKLSSANSFSLVESKICRIGKSLLYLVLFLSVLSPLLSQHLGWFSNSATSNDFLSLTEQKTLWNKVKLVVTYFFSFYPQYFQRPSFFSSRLNSGLCDKVFNSNKTILICISKLIRARHSQTMRLPSHAIVSESYHYWRRQADQNLGNSHWHDVMQEGREIYRVIVNFLLN